MPALFGGIRAPSTLGSFLRGNVLQLGKVHRLLLAELARLAPLLPGRQTLAFIAIDPQQNGSTAAKSKVPRSAIRRSKARACWSAE